MKMAMGNVAVVAIVATAACAEVQAGSPLGDDEARALLAGILDMANEAPLGTHAYACPFGGEAETTVEVTTVQRGNTAYTLGSWELVFVGDPPSCRLAEGYQSLAIANGVPAVSSAESIEFRYLTAVAESGARRLHARASGGGDWYYYSGKGGYGLHSYPCVFYGRIQPDPVRSSFELVVEKEAGDDGPFTGSLVGTFCQTDMEIPLSDFPSTDRLLSSRQSSQ